MISRRTFATAFTAAAALSGVSAKALAGVADTGGPVVSTNYGQLSGVTDGAVHRFLGIPYAQPPVGPLRWRAPQPPSAWTGVRQATAFGNIAPQGVPTPTDYGAPESEDCLYLNVWTETLDASARQPVMLWIHGGGNLYGAASHPTYDGSALARRGVTLVSFNYRLGVLGFLSHPKVGGNFAVQDYVAALEWIRDNIAGFGGDPGNVTIFGQSAGAVAVRTLLASPPAAGLFHRAIIESAGFEAGAASEWWSRERNETAAEEVFELLGGGDADDLRAKPLAEVMAAARSLSGARDRPGYVRTPAELVWMPVVDGAIVAGQGDPAWGADVPVMLGTVENEARLFFQPTREYDRPLLERMTASLAGPAAAECMTLFDASGLTPYEALDALMTTVVFTEPAAQTLRNYAAQNRDIRYYHFTRNSPAAIESRTLASHAVELPYLFGTLPESGYDAVDARLAESIQAAWVSFARTGEPSGGMPGVWPRFTTDNPQVTLLGDTVQAQPFSLTPLGEIINDARAVSPHRNWLGEAV